MKRESVPACATHDTETVERSDQIGRVPQTLENGSAQMTELPLWLRVANILNHATVQFHRFI